MWDALFSVQLFHFLHDCDVNVPRAMMAKARAKDANWWVLQCLNWFSYDSGFGKVEVVLRDEIVNGKQACEGDLRIAFELPVRALYMMV